MHTYGDVDLDFKLLLVFQKLMATRKVTEAADQMGISQPTISRSLSRLRKHFGDPLFVRTQNAMQPTPRALELGPYVDDMINMYQDQLVQQKAFDPTTSKRTFGITASEIGHLLLLPKLLNTLADVAPSVRLKATPLGMHSLIDDLESGNIDLAFGGFPKLFAGVHGRAVGQESYICMARKDHPDIEGRMSLKQFRAANHVIVSAQGMGHIHEQIEQQLCDVLPADRVRVVTHHFLTSVLLAEQTDLVVTLPSRAGRFLGDRLNLQVFKSPVRLPTFDIKLYWHERFHRAPSNKWLRNLIVGLF